jgi:hypothetical protein
MTDTPEYPRRLATDETSVLLEVDSLEEAEKLAEKAPTGGVVEEPHQSALGWRVRLLLEPPKAKGKATQLPAEPGA